MRLLVALIAACLVCVSSAMAQTFPSKPVRVVIPFAAGGSFDIVARLIGQKFQESTGQPLVIDNRPGAGGLIGADLVAKAAPDGYTLLMPAAGQITSAPALYASMPYDPATDLVPVTHLVDTPMVLVVSPTVPAQSADQLVALAKAKPGGMNFGSAGNGSVAHLLMELFEQQTGIQMVHIPYKGIVPALTDVAAGRVDAAFTTIASAKAHLDGGNVRPLVLASTHRTAALQNVPTTTESGIPGVDVPVWIGIMAPKGTPGDVVARLHSEFTKALADPDVRERLTQVGAEVVAKGPAEYGAMLREDTARWKRVVQAGNIKVD